MLKFLRPLSLVLAIGLIGGVSDEARGQAKPKYGAADSPKPAEQPKPKYGPSAEPPPKAAEPKPKYGESPKPADRSKPIDTKPEFKPKYESGGAAQASSGPLSDKARANREAQSERSYAETHKAPAPPKSSYTDESGRTVPVRADSKHVEYIRSQPSKSYTPEVRQQHINVFVTEHHYPHPYGWYTSQPPVYVGGGYSSAFWYMMADWDAQRRAQWFYNNRYNIDNSAYERGMHDAQVARLVADMENRRAYRNADYVDPQFAKDPSVMYDQAYIEAAYNPTVVHTRTTDGGVSGWAVLVTLFWIFFGVLVLAGLYCLIFKARFGGG